MGAKKKKKPAHKGTLPKEIRLKKARQWILTYNGTPKRMAGHYRERFHVDMMTAIADLKEIGVEFTQEYLDAVKKNEEERIRQKHLKKQEKEQERQNPMDGFSDGTFAYIAGYTDGGAPYGITWDELGIEPYAPYEKLMEAYARLEAGREEQMADTDDDSFWEDMDIMDDIWQAEGRLHARN